MASRPAKIKHVMSCLTDWCNYWGIEINRENNVVIRVTNKKIINFKNNHRQTAIKRGHLLRALRSQNILLNNLGYPYRKYFRCSEDAWYFKMKCYSC